MPDLNAPIWIDNLSLLKQMVEVLGSCPRIAVDTESNSLYAYREQVCLLQFSTADNDYLVDPLAIPELSALAPIFANSRIEKVFHAAEYDLTCLKRDFNFSVKNLYDTMQSARILGYKRVGLDALLAMKFDVQVDKRFQKANWAKRPLTSEQIHYARMDTHYLLPLRGLLQAELEAAGKWDLAREEFNRLSQNHTTKRADIPPWQRISGTQELTRLQMSVLQELSSWRELASSRLDRPPFKVLDDNRLVALARRMPTSRRELTNLLTPHQMDRFASEILRTVAQGQKISPQDRPKTVRPSGAFLRRMDLLTQWRKATAQRLHLEADIILPKSWMQAIAENDPHTEDELARLMPDSPWRLEILGVEILRTIAPKKKG